MNNTVYHTVDVKIDPRLPTPGIKDVAEEFGTSAAQLDAVRGVQPVNAQQGVYRVGATGAGTDQIKKGHAAKRAEVSPDFYLR